MRVKSIMLSLLACFALAINAQEADDNVPVEWFLHEVVGDAFVQGNAFEYYYTPSASDTRQQIASGNVTYFLNTPQGLSRKRTCDLIDRIMASYDGVRAMNDWQATGSTHWKEFRCERNKFHFSVKDKALEDGTYYVSVTETANAYKTLGKSKQENKQEKPAASKRGARSDRRPVVLPDEGEDKQTALGSVLTDEQLTEENSEEISREQERLNRREREAAKRLEREKQREQAKAEKEAQRQRQAEEKKAKKEQEALKKEQEKQLRLEERQRQAEERQQQALARQEEKKQRQRQAAYDASKYHYSDVALWLSDKYDFTQTGGGENALTMFTVAIKDIDMVKLAIKNALKGSNARMAMPWRMGSQEGTIETGYSIDGHVLVFVIGSNDSGNITLTIIEMDNEEFAAFKQNVFQ